MDGRRYLLWELQNIAARKQAQEALHREQIFNAALLENVAEGVVACDASGKLRLFNKTSRDWHGMDALALPAEEWAQHYDLYELDGVTPLPTAAIPLVRAFAGETVCAVGMAIVAQGQPPRYIQANGGPIFDAQGGKIGAVVVMYDVTERRKAAESLRESEEHFRCLASAAFEGLLIHRHGVVLDANEALATMFGFKSAKELIHKQGLDVVPLTAESQQTIRNQLAAGQDSVFEVAAIGPNGAVVTLETQGRDIVYKGCQARVVAMRDITARKRAENALRESEEKFRALFEQAGDHVMMLDPHSTPPLRILNVNDAACRAYGYTRQEMLELCISDLDPAPDADRNREIDARLARGENAIFEVMHRRKDGSLFPVEVCVGLVRIAGCPPFVFSTDRDITERKRVEQETKKLQDQLTHAQRMDSVGRLAGGVAHDFNNMLQAILGNASLALDELPPDSPTRESLEEIQKSAQRSADLTQQLLAFARKQTTAPKVLDLNEKVENMLKMLRRLIGEDIALSWLPGHNLDPVRMDPSQLDQVLTNLCVNARDALQGAGKLTIKTERVTLDGNDLANDSDLVAGDYVELTVSDTGCGMDQEVLAHLFEPFFTTKATGKGTGLGLATVHGIIKQNGGSIRVYSEPGLGTTFRICLPSYVEKAVQLEKQGAAQPGVRGQETILLVEDEPAILRVAKRSLEKLGYSVLAAGKPGEAISLAEKHPGQIHLLMTDVVMPEMNGRDLAKRLLSLYPDIRRLFMSGYPVEVIAHHGVLDEGIHFLQKPFSTKDLSDKVRAALMAD
jgi:PAS domain S-box-containing protein